jgi:cytochrome c-type biogenesis protein CcmH
MVLEDCACKTAIDLLNQIHQKIADGETNAQIIAGFRATYGDVVLVTPPKSGLELILWTLPIIIAVAGTTAIYEYSRGKTPFPTSELRAPIAENDDIHDVKHADEEIHRYERIFCEEYDKFKKKQE